MYEVIIEDLRKKQSEAEDARESAEDEGDHWYFDGQEDAYTEMISRLTGLQAQYQENLDRLIQRFGPERAYHILASKEKYRREMKGMVGAQDEVDDET